MKPKLIEKSFISDYIFNKIKIIPKLHIVGVLNILYDELDQEFRAGKKVRIGNFGFFIVKKQAPRPFINVATGIKAMSKGNKNLKFILFQVFKKILTKNLDIAKTFPDIYDKKKEED